MSAYSPIKTFKPVRVYVETTPVIGADGWRKYDGGGSPVAWTLKEELKAVSVMLTSGRAPSMAVLELRGGGDAPLRTCGAGFELTTGLDSNGDPDGYIVRPTAVGIMDQVQICLYDPDEEEETVIFIGIMVDIVPDWQTEVTRITCLDFRFLMGGAPVIGWTLYHPPSASSGFLSTHLPVFNPRGLPNRYLTGSCQAITAEGHEDADDWTRGHIWNGLRYHFNTDVPVDGGGAEILVSTAHFLVWLALVDGAHGDKMFDEDNVWPDLTLPTQLDAALDLLARRRGGYDWWLEPRDDPANDWGATLRLYGTAPLTIEAAQAKIAVIRGEPGKTVAECTPDVIGGSPGWDASRVFLSVRGVGAKRRYDLTFDTVAVTLAKGWSAADETAWLALSTPERKRQYKNVFCRWVVDDDLSWAAKFGWPLNFLRERIAGATLLSLDESTKGADGRPVRLRAQIWRSKDAGETWEEMPRDIGGVMPAAAGLGVELSEAARSKWWSWNAIEEDPEAWDIRITISVEADARVAADTQTLTGTGWPRRERLLLDDSYRYEARRLATMNARSSGEPPVYTPALDGGEPHEFGPDADDAIRDDSAALTYACAALKDQLARLGREGPIILAGIREDMKPGVVITQATGGGDRPTEPMDVVVRRVSFQFAGRPQTTIHVEAD